MAHQLSVGLEQGGLLLIQKCQFRLTWEVFFIRERAHWQSRDFPHLMQSNAQFAYRGEESPCGWAVQFEDGVEVRYTHLDAITSSSDSLAESQPLQIFLKMGQDIQSQVSPPGLGRMNLTWGPEVSCWVVVVDSEELISKSLSHSWIFPTRMSWRTFSWVKTQYALRGTCPCIVRRSSYQNTHMD